MNGRLVYGRGIYEKGLHLGSIGGVQTREYLTWKQMLGRCYCTPYLNLYPSYKGCEVSENFKNFQFFAEWCNQQIGFGNKGWQLDKDILVRGNKLYSETTCCFVPKEINNLFTLSGAKRGEYLIGVSFNRKVGKYQSSIKIDGRHIKLGYFHSEEDAFLCYKKAKESRIKDLAEKYKQEINPMTYQSLIGWGVDVQD